MSKQTAVEWLVAEIKKQLIAQVPELDLHSLEQQAKEIEKKQLFLASNTSAKESYRAGQETMWCGCYEIADQTTYEEWLYEQFKSEEE